MTQRARTEDPRAAKTKAALQAAVLALFATRPVAQLTVSDVVTEAGVNRSSFYMHYSDLHELYADALDELIVRTGELGDHASGADAARSADDVPLVVSDFIGHVARNAEVYRWALGPQGSPRVADRIRRRFQSSLQQGFAHHLDGVEDADLGFGAQAAFLSGAMLGTITAWLSVEPLYPADRFAAWLWAEVRTQFAGMVERASGRALFETSGT